MKEEKFDKLLTYLQSLKHPALDAVKKEAIKSNVLSQIRIVRDIRVAVADLEVDVYKKASIKEKLFEVVENHSQKRSFFSKLFVFHKKLISSVLAVALFLGLFGFVNVDTSNVVRAATFTNLKSFQGGVLVERAGEFVDPYLGMQILEKDQIITGEDGEAVIKYFDDSLSRLDSNTKILIKRLDEPEHDSLRSNVEVVVLVGNAWFKVVNLVDSDTFMVRAMEVSTSAKKAAFSVKVDRDLLEIGVFKNSVEVRTGDDHEKIVKGTKILVSEDVKEVKVLEVAELDDEWVQNNLESDKVYITDMEEKILLAKAEAIGIEVDDDFSLENSLREDALLLLTFDDVKKEKIEFELAEKKFLAAQVKLHDPDLTEEEKGDADLAIVAFSEEVNDFYELIEDVSFTDDKYAADLESFLGEKILAHKKDLSLSLPDTPAYQAKLVIDELELLAADGKEEILEIKVVQVDERLSEVEDVIATGDKVLTSAAVEDYKESVSDVIELLEDLEEGEVKEVLGDEMISGIDLLEAIEVVSDEEVFDLKTDVAEASGVELPEPEVVVSVGVEEEEEVIDPKLLEEPITIDSEFGVKIKGDKPLSPLF